MATQRRMSKQQEEPEEEMMEEEGAGDVGPIEPQPPPPQGFMDEQVRNAPAWLISIVGHGMFILLTTAITFAYKIHIDEMPEVISIPPAKIDKVQEPEKPRDVFNRKGLPAKDPSLPPTNEPRIFFPEAEESDHNESADNEDYGQMKGNSFEAMSYLPGDVGEGIKGRGVGSNAAGVYDSIGVGGGGGGSMRYGGRFGGRRNLVARGGGGTGTESAVDAALKWLCRHQNPDGSWGASGFQRQCVGSTCPGTGPGEFDVGVSGLALLAFLGRGYTHLSKEYYYDFVSKKEYRYGEVVKKAITWLISQQDAEGCIGKAGSKYMYNHSTAALALAEAYGMTNENQFKDPAQKAVNYIVAAQNQDSTGYDRKAWRYTYRPGDNDTSVMGWCVMALKSAEISGLFSGKGSPAYGGAITWVKEVTDENNSFRVGYTAKGTGKVSVRGVNDSWSDHDALTAIGMLVRIFVEKNKNDPALKGGAERLTDKVQGTKNIPKWDNNDANGKLVDYYHWYYATLAMFQYDGPDGPKWKEWNNPMKEALVKNQHIRKDGCMDGSWPVDVDRWGFEGGRVYTTAINALTLEVYYRYDAVFMKNK